MGGEARRLPNAARNSCCRSMTRTVGPTPIDPLGPVEGSSSSPRLGTTTTSTRNLDSPGQAFNGIVVLGRATRWARRPGTSQSELHEPLPHRVQNGLRPVVDVELLIHVADVVADGLFADLQLE